jgi:multidrug efflux pump subunit AcrB
VKKIIEHFIRYEVVGWVLIIGIVILGYLGMNSLKSSFFPLTKPNIININLTYPGASPQEMEEGVVLKIEDNIRGLVGIDRFTSSSNENSASITVEVQKGFDIDVVLADVKNAVDKVPSFPSGMEPPVVSKRENLTQAINFVVTGTGVSLKSLKEIARNIENDLRNVEGLSQVSISGFPDEEISVSVNEAKLLAYNLTFSDVANAVSQNNILVTGGTIKTEAEDYLIRVSNRNYFADELSQIIIRADASGNTVRLNDVAVLEDAWSENPNRSYFNGESAINVKVETTNNEDLIFASNAVVKYIEEFNSTNFNVNLQVTRDSSITIRDRTKLLLRNGAQGILLVLLLLSIFLKPRLAFWVAFGIPISFFGMFMLAQYFNITINVLSLFGMIIVIGILVDDGIVIAENIYHHFQKGKTPVQAAIDGTLEVLPAIVSAILTTLIAFSTFFFLDGRVGEFFGEVTVIVFLTLLISLVEALVILPAHVAHSKALTKGQKTYWFNKYADQFMVYLRDVIYQPALRFVIRYKFFGFALIFSAFIITIGALRGGIIKGTFFPVIASDVINVNLKMPQGVNPKTTDSIITSIEQVAFEVGKEFNSKVNEGQEAIINIIKNVGPGTASGSLVINLLPGEQRDFPASEIAAEINKRVGDVPLAESVLYNSGTNFGGRPVSIALLGNNIKELKSAKDELKQVLKTNSKLRDIDDNDPSGIKEISITLKEKGYLLGFTLNQVIAQVRSGFFGLQAQRFQRGQDEIKVWVRYDLKGRSSISDLENMRIVNSQGQRVPLREIADFSIERGEISINHLNGKREIKVEADLVNPKESASDILGGLKSTELKKILERHPTVQASFEGQNREASKTTSSAAKVGPIILLLIYIVIAFTFRSFSQPLLLLVMIPFSLIGVGWGHYIHGFPINILSFLGIIALIGILVNDGLVLIGKFNSYMKDGNTFNESLILAGRSRFRAIFLTSITTIAGLSPLIFEKSLQAQFLIPMAISIAYGIGIATVLTLFMLPMMLSLGNQIKIYAYWFWEGKRPSAEEVERAYKELQNEKNEA